MDSTETDVDKKFSSSLMDLLKTLSSVNITYNATAFVRGQLNITVDLGEPIRLIVDENIYVEEEHIRFVSNTYCSTQTTTSEQLKELQEQTCDTTVVVESGSDPPKVVDQRFVSTCVQTSSREPGDKKDSTNDQTKTTQPLSSDLNSKV